MIDRILTHKLLHFAGLYPVVSVTGPRQSGKTTLVKQAFPNYHYVTLEDIDTRNIALSDPKGFLENFKNGLIIDEIQRLPELFSYMQGIVDKTNHSGQFIITGSQNFLLMENISQTLAGRIAILKLLPLSLDELNKNHLLPDQYEQLIFNGFYPRLFDKQISPTDFYPFYTQTYIERDVKLLKNISNQNTFIRFIQMCAGRTGQLLNITELANSCGITQITAKSWLSILEASYVLYFFRPHYKNYNKRLVKMPKLYFYDTGLLCSLLGIKSNDQLKTHFLFGGLFENFIVNEFIKHAYNHAIDPELYFWRDKHGKEIDLLVDTFNKQIPIEIKAGKTLSVDYFKNLNYWNKISGNSSENSFVIYGGDDSYKTKNGQVYSWKNISELFKLLNS